MKLNGGPPNSVASFFGPLIVVGTQSEYLIAVAPDWQVNVDPDGGLSISDQGNKHMFYHPKGTWLRLEDPEANLGWPEEKK